MLRDGIHHVADCGVSQGRPGVGGDGFEHLPAAFEIVRVTGDAIHDEDRFDRLWTVLVVSIENVDPIGEKRQRRLSRKAGYSPKEIPGIRNSSKSRG